MTAQRQVQDRIEQKLAAGVPGLMHLEVINESDRHNVPAGSESHFKVILVADAFEDIGLVNRHRLVNHLLSEELSRDIHALAIHAYSEEEWQSKMGNAPMSPPCLGGGKAQRSGTGF